VDREVIPNFPLLRNAIEQSGPWAGQSIEISPPWFVQSMRSRIEELDWKAVREDVSRFLPHRDQEGLALWTSEYFLYHLEKLASYLQ
jgi:hypothetical protein